MITMSACVLHTRSPFDHRSNHRNHVQYTICIIVCCIVSVYYLYHCMLYCISIIFVSLYVVLYQYNICIIVCCIVSVYYLYRCMVLYCISILVVSLYGSVGHVSSLVPHTTIGHSITCCHPIIWYYNNIMRYRYIWLSIRIYRRSPDALQTVTPWPPLFRSVTPWPPLFRSVTLCLATVVSLRHTLFGRRCNADTKCKCKTQT